MNSADSRAAVQRRLLKRYRDEARFRAFGIAAIVFALSMLALLIGSIGSQAITAFSVNEVTLPITLEADRVDPLGDRSAESLRRGSYNGLIQDALREQFPDVTERADLRELFGLYTPLVAARLLNQVSDDPSQVGETIDFTFPISDHADLYLKGAITDRDEMTIAGPVRISATDGRVELVSPQAVFAPLRDAVIEDLNERAETLEARGDRYAARSEAMGDRGAQSAGDAQAARAEAAALRTQTSADGDGLTLTPRLPSRLVRIADGYVAIDTIAADGRSVSGRVLVAPVSETADGASILSLTIPAADRRFSDAQIAWTETLAARGVVEQRFNTWLFTNADSREPELAGVLGAMIGTILTITVTMLLAMPIGVFTAIYLEEFAPKNRLTDLIEVNINNLAAVPSIVFGLLGLAVFINTFGLPRSAPLVGGMVLALMTLPTIIISARAALKAVPPSIREAALGVGASKTQTVFHHVLPLSAPGILTGSIIGMAQAMGETAPLLMIGMVAFIADVPSMGIDGFTDPATVMPVQIFLWSDGAERAFEARTAAAIIVLLGLMITFNALAVFLRRRFETRW
ncbi:MAG: phosphate ABC transporter, permease protein PstA [Maricaulis sp.]|jgi:phosphate transport system permease protein|nr:phosphate ABC transporter, permease protein PstA [Maricaulis sp.]HAQ34159.1 phosphate ABC transporter permease PtsA [Alphaproteobacteria bacterium]